MPDKSQPPVWKQNSKGNPWAFFANDKQISGAFPDESYKENALGTINKATEQAVQGQFKSFPSMSPNILARSVLIGVL